ncbi:hypothetical protein LUW75_10740 [Streptomyces sp. MRC013]|uniref:hypothetical protein n=1 Tax=Streptomyces sp. MRC013 TaxID=2898276 RepID=UPI0020267510|nr:hypothetical protein [Streptomyces sp. MRC013]URM90390.1 hypothetical protein LUW75_10740 [Streptomyces sp. MRC013]
MDGKSYPDRRLTPSDRTRLVSAVHRLKHLEGLSVREIVARLAEDYGIRRSVGWTSEALRKWTCPACPGGVQESGTGEPEHFGGPA